MNKFKFNLCAAGMCCLLAFATPAVQAEGNYLPSSVGTSAQQQLASAQMNKVEVSNVTELLNAIDNNTEIIMKPGTYNISSFFKSDAKKGLDWNAKHPHIMWEGTELTIANVSGLTLRAQDDNVKTTRIVTEEAYDNVALFKHCRNITLVGMTMGHEINPGVCSGSVVAFENCENVNLKNMDLYGCGAYGISGHGINGLTAISCKIHDCSYGMLEINNSNNLRFSQCEFTRCQKYTLLDIRSADALFKNCKFSGNQGDFFNAQKDV
ncbi:MAG: right-handed parallel beta-helix repeat-containing protein, partial [bacterium]|nr:right-handed parallel beta-helix repeat-containing protein [bacterium]